MHNNTIYPRQAVLISSRAIMKSKFSNDKNSKDNLIAVSWHMPVSKEPFLYSIALKKERYSYSMIKESGVFAINFMSIKNKKELLFCGRHTGEIIEKYKETGLRKEECDSIDCSRIKEAVSILECEVVDEFETGDHQIIVGKVIKVIKKSEDKRCFQVEGDVFTTTI